jgi:hypothetical protein
MMDDDEAERDEAAERRAADFLCQRIDEALDYIRKEYDLTLAVPVGVLMFKVHELMHEADEEESDES